MAYRYQDCAARYPTVEDLQKRAHERIPAFARGFLEGGTGYESCLARNRDALNDILFQPRFLRPVPAAELSSELFDKRYAAPFGIAPLGMGEWVWPGADDALLRQSAARGILLTTSIFSSISLEAAGKRGGGDWLQIYPIRDAHMRSDLLRRAEDAGFRTLVVTVDAPVLGRRESMRRHGLENPAKLPFSPLTAPSYLLRHPAWTWGALRKRADLAVLRPYLGKSRRPEPFLRGQILGYAMSWDELARLRTEWKGNLVVKGVLHPADAEKAVSLGLDGIWVSNHGGRQLDCDPAPVDVIVDIRQAVGPKARLFLDSGVRSGLDVIRALARGADFVFLGRPFLYGMAALGDHGATYVIDLLIDDMKNHMALLGCTDAESISGLLRNSSVPCKS